MTDNNIIVCRPTKVKRDLSELATSLTSGVKLLGMCSRPMLCVK